MTNATQIPSILGAQSITVFLDGKPVAVQKTARIFDIVLKAVREGDVTALRSALNIRESITNKIVSAGIDGVVIEDKNVFVNGRQIDGLISTRIFDMIEQGLDVKPIVKFLKNLLQNPSKRAVDELFGFMEVCELPITPDGHFLAWKRVRHDYKDVHSGTVLNKPYELFTAEDIVEIEKSQGKKQEVTVSVQDGVTTVEMPRNMVDEDRDNTCSYGLHFCSYEYLKHFSGERIVVLKINPADVVSIPSDYNNSKGRTSKYQVVGEAEVHQNMPVQDLTQQSLSDYDFYKNEEHEDEDDLLEEIDDSDEAEEIKSDNTLVPGSNHLTYADVELIRKSKANGWTTNELSEDFGVSERTIRRVVAGEAPYNF